MELFTKDKKLILADWLQWNEFTWILVKMDFLNHICGKIHQSNTLYCPHVLQWLCFVHLSLYFGSEVSLLKDLCHENIVRLEDVHWRNDVCVYLVFEYMMCNLGTYITKYEPNGIRLSALRSYVYQIANALKFCHQRAVLHRDLKPENILIDKYGVVKVKTIHMQTKSSYLSSFFHRHRFYFIACRFPISVCLGQ